jgi:hypothetical protein
VVTAAAATTPKEDALPATAPLLYPPLLFRKTGTEAAWETSFVISALV